MTLIGALLYIVLNILILILIARLITEMIQAFSRSFSPPRWFMMVAEPIFVLTDPPVRMLRRWIPPLRMGGVSLDLSVLVLFFILQILLIITQVVFF
ncbi:hypothetical protein B841_08750 [Corynebacterium maris DSM 45190]|uniref:YggT family protein n=1 Tax=Corynebacterium maris DSM 45190 TaxID=1224163 RepID=S5TKJ7_9CORY|nr:YggT family protein [Corynebacterium maris]AGS35223.1 hypothetical protein B841_08750 [Corynebacterium maris DSM 45190]